MPSTSMNLPVSGHISYGPDGPLLVLSSRLDGHDTFLTGSLDVWGSSVPVRIMSFDDATVLYPEDLAGILEAGMRWHGTLHLPHGLRPRTVPPDLKERAADQERSLEGVDEAELRYALTFLSESTTSAIRQARVEAIVSALPASAGTPE
ncbi:hypothetical protein [Streptomonospora salina]|uniref:Uncharacterized protein n=1 Tax=Streptomonospora salina TaxID=104205 RepID=A0A841EFL3_9ACTN|nr:hypothetical protein [Streptomonospora salina]MBB5999843.1 hypothetical protein [Streptomonospora salina]